MGPATRKMVNGSLSCAFPGSASTRRCMLAAISSASASAHSSSPGRRCTQADISSIAASSSAQHSLTTVLPSSAMDSPPAAGSGRSVGPIAAGQGFWREWRQSAASRQGLKCNAMEGTNAASMLD
uniref:Uncharacterized protein n=1 Tax=Oryza brachyantha TaxID=4533 RepID=J3MUU1_ORYBR